MIRRSIGLRTQILLLLLGGAIVPLGIVGAWLASSGIRSGEDLLRDHLNASADAFVGALRGRWAFRRADLSLIASNESTVRAVTHDTLSAVDRVYLDGLASGLSGTISSIDLRDASDRLRWTSTLQSRAASTGRSRPDSNARPSPAVGPSIRVVTPILDAQGRRIGNAVAEVLLSALVPADSARPLVPGGRAAMLMRGSTAALLPLDRQAPFPFGEVTTIGGATWFVVHRSLDDPALDIAVGAPLAPYVARFEQAARVGTAALVVVVVLAIALTTVLATRMTGPLEELAAASDAVVQGVLDRRVAVGGPTEVRRAGTGFNLMTDNLRHTLDALSHKSALAAVGEFATSLSHDVRNALTSIKVDLERTSRRGVPDPVANDLVHRALANVARLESVVTGALRVARGGQASRANVDLRAALRSAVEIVRGTFAALPARLDVKLPLEPVIVRGDVVALQQLFANLLFNAAQSLAAGGQATVTLALVGDEAEVTIIDTGSGISEAELGRVGTPFRTSKANGTGLGLPIVRQIVAGQDGSLSIASEEGHGTTVSVRLPGVNDSFTPIARDVHVTAGRAGAVDRAKR